MSAAVIVHPKAFRGPAGTVALLRLAVRLGCELVSSRRGHILLVPRTTPLGAGVFTAMRWTLPPEAETALISLRPTFGEPCGHIPMERA